MEAQDKTTVTSVPIEAVLTGSKPPWRPVVAGWCALLLGPVAGALVTAASFRRMGKGRKAQQTIVYTLIAVVAVMVPVLLVIPEDAPIKKLIALAVEGAGFSVFPSVLREDYVKWKAAYPGAKPRNDYASAGWALLGLLLYLVIVALILTWEVWRRVATQ
jgi:hypothetical protein